MEIERYAIFVKGVILEGAMERKRVCVSLDG